MTPSEQLQKIIADRQLKISELAWRLKTPEQTVRSWVKGTRVPEQGKLDKLVKDAGL